MASSNRRRLKSDHGVQERSGRAKDIKKKNSLNLKRNFYHQKKDLTNDRPSDYFTKEVVVLIYLHAFILF